MGALCFVPNRKFVLTIIPTTCIIMPKGVFIVKSVKINITLRDDLLERADLYASNNAVTRSGLISLALSQYLDAMQKKPVVADAIGQMGVLLKLAVTGKTDSASMMPLLRR